MRSKATTSFDRYLLHLNIATVFSLQTPPFFLLFAPAITFLHGQIHLCQLRSTVILSPLKTKHNLWLHLFTAASFLPCLLSADYISILPSSLYSATIRGRQCGYRRRNTDQASLLRSSACGLGRGSAGPPPAGVAERKIRQTARISSKSRRKTNT